MNTDGRSLKGEPTGLRFMRKTKLSKTGCWLWCGYKDGKGYGVFGKDPGKPIKAHRFSYENFKGKIPEGLQLDHVCRVRCCVNPSHLEPVTNRENVIRGIAARPAQTHCRSGGHELTRENTYINPRGHRECRICRGEAAQRQIQKRHKNARSQ